MKNVRFLILSILSCTFLNAESLTLSSSQLELLMNKNIVVIDIRRDEEWKKTGIIPNSYRLTFYNKKNEFNLKRWIYILSRLVRSKNTKFVLVSSSSKRSKEVAEILSEEMKYKKVFYLKNGINNWIKEDKKVLLFK